MAISGQTGAYGLDSVSGTMAAGLAAAAPVWSLRWADTSGAKLVLRKLALEMNSLGTGFTAGLGLFEALIARSFTASDSGGTDIKPAANNNERKTGDGTSLVSSLRQSSTAALTAGVRTLDAQPFGHVRAQITVATSQIFVPGSPGGPAVCLYDFDNEKTPPIVLAQDEGIVIRATVPATGTWEFRVLAEWQEVAAAF